MAGRPAARRRHAPRASAARPPAGCRTGPDPARWASAAGLPRARRVRPRPPRGRTRSAPGTRRAAQQLPVRERQRRTLVGSGPRLGQQHARMRPADARAQRDGRQRQGDAPATPTPRRQGQQHGRRHLRAGPGQPPPGMRADRQVRVIAPGKGQWATASDSPLPGETLPQQQRQQGQRAGGQHRAATRRLAAMGIRIRLAPPQPCGGQGQCQRRARGQRQMSGAGTQQARQALYPRPAQGHQPGHPGQRPGRSPGQPRAPRPAQPARAARDQASMAAGAAAAASAIATVLTTSRPGPAAPRRDAATPPASDRPDDAGTAGR